MRLTQELLDALIHIADQAGKQILSLYDQEHTSVSIKSDGSLLTQADTLAHDAIIAGLKNITPDIPVLSEESSEADIQRRHEWDVLWLVDPLDGTKEFIHRTDEFTINIALIVKHQPVLGIVYAPALGVMYYAMDGMGAYKKSNNLTQRIFVNACIDIPIRVVASRRHGGETLGNFLQQLPKYTLINVGSALKICLVAEGAADLYPRLGPTYEWDTAAGHAIINNANGILCDALYRPFQYNKRDRLLNGSFLACRDDSSRLVF